jgi:hypothetical protein
MVYLFINTRYLSGILRHRIVFLKTPAASSWLLCSPSPEYPAARCGELH